MKLERQLACTGCYTVTNMSEFEDRQLGVSWPWCRLVSDLAMQSVFQTSLAHGAECYRSATLLRDACVRCTETTTSM
jgi:hypothetical protein